MSLRAEATPEDRVGDLEEAHKSRNTYETLLSIGGMTCSVCTGKVAETLQVFPFVKEVGINLMSNSGTVVFESTGDGMQEVAQLVDEIESIGYEAAMYRIKNLTPPAADLEITGVRQLALNVDGMCQSCPPAIVLALERTFMDLTIVAEPTVKTPLLRISYTPHQPDTTIRKIIDRIKATNPKFEISVYHPPTIEERSIMNQRRERNNYLIRLAFCTICAIPTFMIGVVWMALVPADHPIRMFLEEPIWIGSVSRIEWSLLIISTPVMFYCANPFHTRAIRETIAMWRPGSAVPFFRRFYRFGSMNLLISLGVSISYFSSIAMLGLAAAEDKHHMRSGHTTTYFDSTVFLTMFLLMGIVLLPPILSG